MNYNRLFIFILYTLLSAGSLVMALGIYMVFIAGSEKHTYISSIIYFWLFISSYAWIVYFTMGWYWIKDKSINLTYMRSGHFAGLLSALIPALISPFALGVIFALPAIIMATTLLTFHTNKAQNEIPNN